MALHILGEVEREQLRVLIEEKGLAGVAKFLDVSRGVVSSAVAGIGVRKGSLEQLKAALENRTLGNHNGSNGVSK